jgi:hypothetical protein
MQMEMIFAQRIEASSTNAAAEGERRLHKACR